MHGRLRLALARLTACAERVETKRGTGLFIMACHDFAEYLEALLDERWGPQERREIDQFLREFLFVCYEVRCITGLSFLQHLKFEDIAHRVRTLENRLATVNQDNVTKRFYGDAVSLARSVQKLCKPKVYGQQPALQVVDRRSSITPRSYPY